MYRLLIIDDEPEVLDWLYTLFIESDLPLDVYKTQFATDALTLMESAKIDIVLSDIRMPGMNGLKLMEEIQARWPQCKVIFLTGYDQFEYAHSAIKMGAAGFILKNEGDRTILGNVADWVERLEKTANDEQLLSRAENFAKRMSQLEAQQYIANVLYGATLEGMQTRLRELGIPLGAEHDVRMVLGCFEEDTQADNSGLFALLLKGMELMEQRLNVFGIALEERYVLWLVQSKTTTDSSWTEKDSDLALYLEGVIEELQYSCMKTMGKMSAFAVGSKRVGWSSTPAKFQYLKQLLLSSVKNGNGVIVSEHRMPAEAVEWVSESEKQTLIHGKEEFQYSLDRSNKEEISTILEKLKFQPQGQFVWWQNGILHLTYTSLAVAILSYIHRWKLNDEDDFREQTITLMHAEQHASWEEALHYLKQLALACISSSVRESGAYNHFAVDRVCKWIRDNPGDDLSLLRLSQYAGFNPSYFSRLFKSCTGQNLIDYIKGVKIQIAKGKLLESNVKINHLSAQLGFGSAHYFSRFFKSMTGLSPQEYREKQLLS